MRVLYVSQFLDDDYFKCIFDNSKIKPLQSIQKFNKLFISGIGENKDIDVITVLSSAPINKESSNKLFWKGQKKTINNLTFKYVPFINLKIIKYICFFFFSIFQIIFWMLKNGKDDSVIIIDGFYPIISTNASILGKLFNYNNIVLYTDLPKCMNHNYDNPSIIKRIAKFIVNFGDKINIKYADMFLLLTEQMNEIVNKENKPYIVIEGFVDNAISNKIIKNREKIFFYAGGLYEKYGVKLLIDSFIKWNNNDYELWLCGEGDLVEYINKIKSKNIKYLGSIPNNEVVKIEKKATLLINPRFSTEEYTKYSFPSKNMEYMVSGTPVLTTNLPGMPKEYKDKVFIIEKDNKENYIKQFNKISKMNLTELNSMGRDTQKYMIKNKNNKVQGKKFVDFTKKNFVNKGANIKLIFVLSYFLINLFLVLYSKTNPIGLYNVSNKTYILYMLSVILTSLGMLIPLKNKKKINNCNNSSKTINLDNKYFRIFELITLVIIIFYLIKYNIIIADLDKSERRLAAFSLLFSNSFETLFYIYIITNIINVFTILLPILLFSKDYKIKENKFNIFIMLVTIIIYNFIGFSRMFLFKLLIGVAIAFFCFDGKINLKKVIKIMIFTFIIFLLSCLMLNFRIYGFDNGISSILLSIKSQGQQIIEYFLGSLRMLDRFIGNGFIAFKKYTYGRATFAGFDEIVTYPIKLFDDNLYSFNNIIGDITQKGYAVGNLTPYYNAFYTSVMNFYLDFGTLGVIIFSLIHGIFISYVISYYYKKKTLFSCILLIFVYINLLMTLLKWEYQSGCTVFLIIVLFILDIIFKKRERCD